MLIHGRTTPSIVSLADRLQDVDIAIRWGGDCVPDALNGECHLLNGLEQLERFRDNDILCPLFTTDRGLAKSLANDGYTFFGRKLNHTQGKDIRISSATRVRGYRRWLNSDYYTMFVPSVAEWRFHIVKGMSILRAKKELPSGWDSQNMIRSRRNGYRYRYDIAPKDGLREAAKRAVEVLGYDFAAVDILETEDGHCVLECNSRPGIRDSITLTAYEKAIRNI